MSDQPGHAQSKLYLYSSLMAYLLFGSENLGLASSGGPGTLGGVTPSPLFANSIIMRFLQTESAFAVHFSAATHPHSIILDMRAIRTLSNSLTIALRRTTGLKFIDISRFSFL